MKPLSSQNMQAALRATLDYLTQQNDAPVDLICQVYNSIQPLKWEESPQEHFTLWTQCGGEAKLESITDAQHMFCTGFEFALEKFEFERSKKANAHSRIAQGFKIARERNSLTSLNSIKEELNIALTCCSDVDVLLELEDSVDDAVAFVKALGLNDRVQYMSDLPFIHKPLIKAMLVDLLRSHTLELVHPKGFSDEYQSMSEIERNNLHGLSYVNVVDCFA
uniref:Uncharacterized protein n=2 Tax=Vibrio TaxID=662 RepID=A0A0H3ZLU7_9VIBR|nr:hypothetical protein [Vibrio cyclitrophicus]AKN38216.1 hypothetical protein [Vibrio splendidus]